MDGYSMDGGYDEGSSSRDKIKDVLIDLLDDWEVKDKIRGGRSQIDEGEFRRLFLNFEAERQSSQKSKMVEAARQEILEFVKMVITALIMVKEVDKQKRLNNYVDMWQISVNANNEASVFEYALQDVENNRFNLSSVTVETLSNMLRVIKQISLVNAEEIESSVKNGQNELESKLREAMKPIFAMMEDPNLALSTRVKSFSLT